MTDANDTHDQLDKLDQAVAQRLQKLADAPIDVTELQRRLDQAIENPDAVSTPAPAPLPFARWWRPISSIAAAIVVAVTIALVALQGGEPVMAAPIELGRLHEQLLSGEIKTTQASSIKLANQVISAQQKNAPQLPRQLSTTVQSCCLVDVQGVLVASVIMEFEGHRITLVVADGKDFARPMGTPIVRNNKTLYAHKMDGLQMIMANDGDHWLCVMGELPVETLATIAADIEF